MLMLAPGLGAERMSIHTERKRGGTINHAHAPGNARP